MVILIAVAFIISVIVFTSIKPAACTALYAGTALYALYLPAGLLVKWKLSRGFPIAFLVYFLSLIAAGLLVLSMPQIGEEFFKIREAQARYYSIAYQCPLGKLITTLQAVFLAPLVEEVIFRGILFEETRRALGAAPAYFVSSLAFALLHYPGLGALPIFVIALSLAFAYQRYGLPASVMIHAFQNTVATLLFY